MPRTILDNLLVIDAHKAALSDLEDGLHPALSLELDMMVIAHGPFYRACRKAGKVSLTGPDCAMRTRYLKTLNL